MKSPYIAYYTHIAQLKQYANKHTVFMAHMLSMMVFDPETKQNVVSLNPRVKRNIMTNIEAKCKDPLRSANQYLVRLKKSGVIKSIGGGDYLVDPESYGYAKYVGLELRLKSKAIYCSYEFTDNGVTETHGTISPDGKKTPIETVEKSNGIETDENGQQYAITEDGERVELA